MKTQTYIFYAILAAAFYALNAPVSKLLLLNAEPTMMAAFLYLGAGFGMLILSFFNRKKDSANESLSFQHKDIPYIIGMIILDILAPIFLMFGLKTAHSANVSLLNNFEIVATSLIALVIFKEKISKRLWSAIALITLSSIMLSIEDPGNFQFSYGSLFVICACICWGFENNCTKELSHAEPRNIVIIKGFGSGFGSLLLALAVGEHFPAIKILFLILLLGFVAYGLSVYFYVYAQRGLGATRTSSYYAISPFIGVLLSLIIFKSVPGTIFWIALILMAIGTYMVSTDN